MSKSVCIGIAKALVALVLIYVVYHTLFVKHNFNDLIEELDWSHLKGRIAYLIVAIGLVTLNWIIEAMKWREVVNVRHDVTVSESIRSVLAGISLGMVTPALSGEYVGRLALLPKSAYGAGLVATFICSLAQSIVTIVIGLVVLSSGYLGLEILEGKQDYIFLLSMIAIGVIAFIYVKLTWILTFLRRVPFITERIDKYTDYHVQGGTKFKVLILALLRYMIYTTQYLLILIFFGVEVSALMLIVAISVIFFFQTMLPLPPISSLMARGEIAILVLGVIGVNPIMALLCTLSLWVINLILPALLGLGVSYEIVETE